MDDTDTAVEPQELPNAQLNAAADAAVAASPPDDESPRDAAEGPTAVATAAAPLDVLDGPVVAEGDATATAIVEFVTIAPVEEAQRAVGEEATPSVGAAGRYDALDASNTDDVLVDGGDDAEAAPVVAGGEIDPAQGNSEAPTQAPSTHEATEGVPTKDETAESELPVVATTDRPPTATPSRRGSGHTQKDFSTIKGSHRRIPAPLVMRPGSGKSVASTSSLTMDDHLCDYDGGRSPNHHTTSSVTSSYRIPLAITPSTRATTPASYFIPPPSIASVPVKTKATGTVVRVRSVVNERYDALRYPPSSADVDGTSEVLEAPEGHVVTGPKLAELVSIANDVLADLPNTLSAVLAHDTQRVREVMTTLCSFLTTFSAAAHAAVDDAGSPNQNASNSGGGNVGSGQHLHREIQRHRPKRASNVGQVLDAQLQAFFPAPSIVQVTVPAEGRCLDIARVAHDGSHRITMHRVPLSVALASTAVEERRAAWEQARKRMSSSTASPSPDDKPGGGGSPKKTPDEALAAPPVPGDVAKRVAACKKAADALSMAQEHCALVQLYLDAASSTAASMASQPKGQSMGHHHRLGSSPGPKKKASNGPSSTAAAQSAPQQVDASAPSSSSVADALADLHADLTRQMQDTDKQLRDLKNTPSLVAATKAHQQQRIVAVDKEDVLHRDRLQLRASLDVVAACLQEREYFQTMVREERRLFQASTQSLKSSTAGRDDELAAKNKAYLGLHVKYRELGAENVELKDMVRIMAEHVEHLERRIDASKRISPQPGLFATANLSSSCGNGQPALPTGSGGGGVGASFAGHTVNSLNGSTEVPRNGNNFNDSPVRRQSPSPIANAALSSSASRLDRTQSTSSGAVPPAIYSVAPDLSMPRRLSSLQQDDLSKRLHDKPLRMRRSHEEQLSSSAKRRTSSRSPPSFMCGRSHSVPVHEQLGSGLMPPTVEELNQRLYSGRKGQREALRNVLFRKLEAAEAEQEALRPLRLKGKPGTTPQDVQQCVDKLYTKSMEARIATRTKLFEELVLDLERPYSPKKLQPGELEETVKRLSATS